MKTIRIIIIAVFLSIGFINAQSIYVYRAGAVVFTSTVATVDSISFTAPPVTSVTDYDGNVYHFVTIGTQTWLLENLKTTHFRNGDPIPNISKTDNAGWAALSTPGYCDNENSVAAVGNFYNFYATSDSRGIAPVGFHIPTRAEMFVLANYLGGLTGVQSGGKLKDTGTSTWFADPNSGATNSTGWTGYGGGYRTDSGTYGGFGQDGLWGSSDQYDASSFTFFDLHFNNSDINLFTFSKKFGATVRCIKD